MAKASSLGDEAVMKRCNLLLRERGILKSESKYYISTAHTDEDIRFTIDTFANAISELKFASAAQ